MKKELFFALFSRTRLSSEVALSQLEALNSYPGGLLRPDKCSEYEPIRGGFDPNDLGKPVAWLSKPHGRLFFRKGKPTKISGQIWSLFHSPGATFDSPLFCSRWTGKLDGDWILRQGSGQPAAAMEYLFRVAEADFGFVTPISDFEAKNTNSLSYSYQGLDLGRALPGLYWTNLFSKQLAQMIGLEQLPSDIASLKHFDGGISLKFSEGFEFSSDFDVLYRQRAVIECLGAEHFFDIALPNRELGALRWDCMPR